MQVTDVAGFARTAGREVRRIEVEDHLPMAQQRAERDALVVLIRQRELRCAAPDGQHGVISVRRSLWNPRGIIAVSAGTVKTSLELSDRDARIARLAKWGGSSAGRASRSQCEGRGFD